jgi:hypothetical protein
MARVDPAAFGKALAEGKAANDAKPWSQRLSELLAASGPWWDAPSLVAGDIEEEMTRREKAARRKGFGDAYRAFKRAGPPVTEGESGAAPAPQPDPDVIAIQEAASNFHKGAPGTPPGAEEKSPLEQMIEANSARAARGEVTHTSRRVNPHSSPPPSTASRAAPQSEAQPIPLAESPTDTGKAAKPRKEK